MTIAFLTDIENDVGRVGCSILFTLSYLSCLIIKKSLDSDAQTWNYVSLRFQ